MATTKGLKGLDKMLNTLNTTKDRTSKRVARAGILHGLTPLAKAMRSGINGSPASQALKKAARKTIGKSLKKGRFTGGMIAGKVGLAGPVRILQQLRALVAVTHVFQLWCVLNFNDTIGANGNPESCADALGHGQRGEDWPLHV